MKEDLISRKSLLQKLDLFNDRKNGNKHFLLGIETAKEIIGDEPAAFDEENVINKIKELKKRYFLTIANTEDEKLAFSYTAVANTLDQVIEIIEKQIVNCEAMIDFNENFDPEEDNTKFLKEKEALLMAIKSIKEVQRYREIGTVKECREAVEKRKPKKPKEILRHRGGFEMQHCPKCDTDYQVDRRYKIKDGYCPACGKLLDSAFRNYCANCGQAIDENLEGMEDE